MSERQMWAVSSGCYSDYRVLCLCESEEVAEAVAVKLRGHSDLHARHDDAFVESFFVVDDDVIAESVLHKSGEVWDSGTFEEGRESVSIEWPFESSCDPCSWRWIRAPAHNGKGGRLEVKGTDHERVRKVFTEKRAMLLADPAMRSERELRGRWGKS